jgi:hypothetical protein
MIKTNVCIYIYCECEYVCMYACMYVCVYICKIFSSVILSKIIFTSLICLLQIDEIDTVLEWNSQKIIGPEILDPKS